jgi:hypothetical protein
LKSFEPTQIPDFVHVLLHQGGVAEGSSSGIACLFRRQAGLSLLFRFQIEMRLQLAI